MDRGSRARETGPMILGSPVLATLPVASPLFWPLAFAAGVLRSRHPAACPCFPATFPSYRD